MNKSELRIKFKNIRKNINPEQVKEKSDVIIKNLISTGVFDNVKTVFVYLSYGREVDTSMLIDYLFKLNKTVLIPKCNINTETMIPVKYSKNEKLTDNFYGIKETDCTKEFTESIDITIVPGIAFDMYGNRIGHGKGYYDKYFENNNSLKIGLCYSDCFTFDKIPNNAQDVAMDYVITDREVYKIKS